VSTEWDVLVIGAGPAGTAAASALVERGLRVAILEKDSTARAKPGEVLTPNAIPILSRLGLLDIVEADVSRLSSPRHPYAVGGRNDG
jgi:2-polyprenyl-6-methoxyphenol hydroxylase-like FAD-dependent oxidoreductase